MLKKKKKRTGQETSANKFFPDPDLTYRLGWRHRKRWTCHSPSEPQPRGSCGLGGSDPAGHPPAHPTPAPTPPPPRRWQQRSRRVDASRLGAPALQPLLLPLQPPRPRKEGGAEARGERGPPSTPAPPRDSEFSRAGGTHRAVRRQLQPPHSVSHRGRLWRFRKRFGP